MKYIAKIYCDLINDGVKALEEVPSCIRPEVEQLLTEK
ncbi:CD1375 family protein [Brevibacillus laterosporus]|nr:CD1375 family protein [Brevibacillus laterosporus]MED2005513.1 CD1375 family protein [Brevibacillus laterosporus]